MASRDTPGIPEDVIWGGGADGGGGSGGCEALRDRFQMSSDAICGECREDDVKNNGLRNETGERRHRYMRIVPVKTRMTTPNLVKHRI